MRLAGRDNEQPIAENSESLAQGRHYTILITPGTNDKTTVSIVSDNIAGPPADKAQVRVINASPEAGEVDIVDKAGNRKHEGKLPVLTCPAQPLLHSSQLSVCAAHPFFASR